MSAYIIGCGGVGSWLTPSMAMLIGPDKLVLVDGDKLEDGNLNRQLFTPKDIGVNKAEALAKRYGIEQFEPAFYTPGLLHHYRQDVLLVGVDNNPAKLTVLQECDKYKCSAIFGANEVHSAEAFYYRPEWKGTKLDPRIYYPEINTDHSGDPTAPRGCTGQKQIETPQLVSANFMAAALVQHLFVFWCMEYPKIEENQEPEFMNRLPYLMRANITRLETLRIGEAQLRPVEKRTDNDTTKDTGGSSQAVSEVQEVR